MRAHSLLVIVLLGKVLLAFALEVKYVKYCGPEDKTLHYSIHPWPVLKPGQYVHVNFTFTPQVDVYYSTIHYRVTTEDGTTILKGTDEFCHLSPKFCSLPAGDTVSRTAKQRVRNIPFGFKGTFKGKAELYNQDLVMWMCFEGEVQL
ncbi:unnamed protein product [Porites lobata]|uniref:MD-2-related lipid-recognition domain-containing protein n=1 Tax=Porites lobata TaxID=104759 RepID=A0ABN8QRK4_9CNID|nr:unnamed protein product [Porites lobata]